MYLLDTNILSYAQKEESLVIQAILKARNRFGDPYYSSISYYEMVFGLLHMGMAGRLVDLDNFLKTFMLIPVNAEIAKVAAELRVTTRKSGMQIGLADELIAATALVHGLTLVTNNEKHFRHLGIPLENWKGQ